MGWNWILSNLNPSPSHTESRRIFRHLIGPKKLPRYDVVLQTQLAKLTKDLHGFSGHPLKVVTDAVASVIIRIAYGDEVNCDVGQEISELHAVTTRQLNWVAGQWWPVEYVGLCEIRLINH